MTNRSSSCSVKRRFRLTHVTDWTRDWEARQRLCDYISYSENYINKSVQYGLKYHVLYAVKQEHSTIHYPLRGCPRVHFKSCYYEVVTEDSRGTVLTFIWSSLERSAASFSRINSFSWATSCSVWLSRSAISSTAISPPAAAAAARGEPGPWGETGKKVCYRSVSLKDAHPRLKTNLKRTLLRQQVTDDWRQDRCCSHATCV